MKENVEQMSPSSDKLTTKQEAAILALLANPTVEQAAKACNVAEVTIYRWQKEEAFSAAYAEARRQCMQNALGALQRATGSATEALVNIVEDKEMPPSSRVSAARSILEYAFRGSELMEMEERLSALEAALSTQEGKTR